MGGNDRQRKSATSFFCFSLFKSKKHRGGYYDEEAYDDGIKAQKGWSSDEDRSRWGVAEPGIDMKVQAFLAAETKKRISRSA